METILEKVKKSEVGKLYNKGMDMYSMVRMKLRPYQIARFITFGILEAIFVGWTIYLKDWWVAGLMIFDLAILASNYFIRTELVRRVSSSLPTTAAETNNLDAPTDVDRQTLIQSKFAIDEVDMWIRMMYIVISHLVGLGIATWSTKTTEDGIMKKILKVFILFVFPVAMNILLPVFQYVSIVKGKVSLKTKEEVTDYFRIIGLAYYNGVKHTKVSAERYIEKKKEKKNVTIGTSTTPNDVRIINYGESI